ncbi:S9 family peptidase [Spongiactinospora gelatinilytica]|uniref:S9 family peptidase n=1 Tax=Spongiactinospora gelatinilytica TaxID=2666298 RepID=A0A2W2EUF9_9ACTN|nr:prolyl oligopeptidase family serine peptidase [Spongiactinospora gelatinilytica]PZG26253.1 S9 family peptidase [Spongiactinospora gelatinilytica]
MSDFPRQFARTRRFTLGVPAHVTLSPDGGTVYFLRGRAGDDPVSCLWALDRATGVERLLADPLTLLADAAEELSPQERTRRNRTYELSSGIVSYATDDACALLVFALSGRLWARRTTDGEPRVLPAAEPVIDPRPDPTGRRIAYVSGGTLRVIEADGRDDRPVAASDGPEVTYGLPEHVATEEMGRHRGYWWSPGGDRLLVARVDTTPVLRWHIADPTDPSLPPATIRYPAAGTANAEVTLWIADVSGGPLTPVGWDVAAFEYLARAGWDARGPYASVQDRSQRHVRVLGVDPDTGVTEVLADQHDDAWVELVPGLPARTAAGALVTSADLDDTRRLVVAGRPVTPPGLNLSAVVAVDGETVLFTASEEPTETHLWAYDQAAGTRRLSAESGVHAGTGRAGSVVLVSRTPDRHGTRTAVRGGGHPPVEIASRAETPVLEPRVEMLTLGPKRLRAALFLPSWHREGPLPVLMDPYGGPALRKVTAERVWWAYMSQWFAEQGFAVLAVDGRGTPGRGPAWERAIHLDIAGPVLEDQVEGLHEAARRFPALDLTRVGIRGWSFGGYLAVLAVLRRPDVFHAAVAGAPVTDQRLYDTHWRERHLGRPGEHPDAYDRCSPIHEAAGLSRPLLLIHGLADDNVVAAHTLRLSAALLAAGRPHEVLPLPRTTHLPSDEAVAANMLTHQLRFLRRELGVAGRPAAEVR